MKNKTGRLITLEGIEGSGKSTQLNKIYSFLTETGIQTIVTREPGGKHSLGRLRDLLLFSKENETSKIEPLSEAFILCADRLQHVKEVISPALNSGIWVVSDRFADATLAYQGYGRGVDIEMLNLLNAQATGGLRADLTVLFDLNPSTGMERVAGRTKQADKNSAKVDRFESEPIDFHKRVREGYLALARAETERFMVVDASKGVQAVFRDIKAGIMALCK